MKLQHPELFRQKCYVNGAWVASAGGEVLSVDNPATGEQLGTVPSLSAEETRAAIQAASEAWPAWRDLTALQRGACLHRWAQLIADHARDLGVILTSEQGKPLPEALGEIKSGQDAITWFAEEGRRAYGEVIPPPSPDRRPLTIRQPVGVVGAVTPWNFPMSMIARKVSPAPAAGCTIVLKPASATPFSALALAVLAHEAGIPAGVFNVVTGKASVVGGELTASPLVRKFTFTGSTEVGKTLMAQCAQTVKNISLELGGNAPFIVFDDADLDKAIAGALASKYRNTGQTCICVNRFLVQEGIHDAFVERLTREVSAMRVGNGLEEGVRQGPLVDQQGLEKVEALVEASVAQGARVAVGGGRHDLGGNFYQPTVLVDLTPDMPILRREIFGPVATVVRFATEEEAIALANDTEYGLASYMYTNDLGRFWRVAEALESGLVGVNETGLASAESPFGGYKQSGLGREGGRQGLDSFLETKYVLVGGLA
ncbi:NAD-dependent succinate-semialdehyde dehydrogenase [Desulfoferula mesophila]|uniref:NAD-dependent succinate-semialdehyde dehydrogenase n=1 Tax=Desulfoferula mesophila TaxID=3058419 RepID=A0AAU9EEM8_9BACT|nr:NAD-dependent succinate-semialdehyde dehydrogenase [Desulfoferula mesophilus]